MQAPGGNEHPRVKEPLLGDLGFRVGREETSTEETWPFDTPWRRGISVEASLCKADGQPSPDGLAVQDGVEAIDIA